MNKHNEGLPHRSKLHWCGLCELAKYMLSAKGSAVNVLYVCPRCDSGSEIPHWAVRLPM